MLPFFFTKKKSPILQNPLKNQLYLKKYLNFKKQCLVSNNIRMPVHQLIQHVCVPFKSVIDCGRKWLLRNLRERKVKNVIVQNGIGQSADFLWTRGGGGVYYLVYSCIEVRYKRIMLHMRDTQSGYACEKLTRTVCCLGNSSYREKQL